MTVFSSLRRKTLIAIAVLLHGFAARESLGAESPPVIPGDLKGECTVIEGKVMMDDYESTFLTLADAHGKTLYFAYGGGNGDTIHYGHRDTGWVQSVAGGDQERALLKILRQTMANHFTPAPNGTNGNYWNYLALKHSVFVLDYRCRHKTATIPWGAVTEHWTFGGSK